MYYTYMLRCVDGSIYTGITTDLDRRISEHIKKDKKCAKYTLTHDVVKLECAWQSENRKMASKLEYHIKKLTKLQKEELILKNNLEQLLLNKIDSNKYKNVRITHQFNIKS